MSDTVIADRPPNDGREWDAQCARCGSSTIYERCPTCGGEGSVFCDGSDEWDESHPCDDCDGRGGWAECGSGHEWCEAHPLPQREDIAHGALEWFVTAGDDDGR